MPPAPLTAALVAGFTGTVGLVHLAIDPTPFDEQRSLLVASGMAILTLVVIAGVLLARGRWSRWAALALGAAWLGIAARGDLDVGGLVVIVGGATMVAISAGPWLPRWLRHRPAADGPPPSAVALLLSLLAMPAVIGLSGPEPGLTEWLGALWALLLATGVSRALPAALWAGRILHLPMLIAVGVSLGLPSGSAVVLLGAAQTALLWRRDVHLAVSPLLPPPSGSVPIPPELVDPAILREAGYDDRGTPLEDE